MRLGIAAIPTLLLPVLFSLGAWYSLKMPVDVLAPPEPAIEEEAVPTEDEAAPPVDTRVYLPVIIPLKASLPDFGGTLMVSIGLALRGDASKALIDQLKDKPEPLISPLGNVLLDTASTVDPAQGWNALRKALPQALMDDLNTRVADLDDSAPILEVLIMEFRIGG
ncbi:hypothetical protein [Pseudoprimorskyibacter insulae]|uniref:Flagellar protein FliL n=1 Tax=Pseudoprimorskyibacter insulae TaxID=1695997 RepID=A0A2R8AVL0_9RHOB|nr:hypothetical protein [Pseudoprimorskyibacter insulae]SPF80065.1 hypothetical protein PRI8871_01867 [Pseudoprimorskyibacter insulae]